MSQPSTMKEAQWLAGRLAALECFIARSAEWSLHFFRILRGSDPFRWGEEQCRAFDELKAYLANPATFISPTPGTPLLLYVATSPTAVSAVLVQEQSQEGKSVQLPVHFVFEALAGPKLRYTEVEKVA